MITLSHWPGSADSDHTLGLMTKDSVTCSVQLVNVMHFSWWVPSLNFLAVVLVGPPLRTVCLTTEKTHPLVRIRSHGSNTTRNSGEFPRYVYLLVIRFPETPDFPMFSISGKLRNSDVSDFRKLQTPTFSDIFVLCNHSHFMPSPFTGDSVRSS